jgi:hypothetical protein
VGPGALAYPWCAGGRHAAARRAAKDVRA